MRSMRHPGLVKLRLVHAKDRTILLPDLVVVAGAAPSWIQPSWVDPPKLDLSEGGSARFCIPAVSDTEMESSVAIEFFASDEV